jgi:hypothetical protein
MEGEGVKRVVEQLTKAGVKPAAIVKDKDGQTLPLFEQAFPGIQENLDLNHTLVAFKARVEAAKKAGNIGITSLVFRCQITNNNDQKKKKPCHTGLRGRTDQLAAQLGRIIRSGIACHTTNNGDVAATTIFLQRLVDAHLLHLQDDHRECPVHSAANPTIFGCYHVCAATCLPCSSITKVIQMCRCDGCVAVKAEANKRLFKNKTMTCMVCV